ALVLVCDSVDCGRGCEARSLGRRIIRPAKVACIRFEIVKDVARRRQGWRNGRNVQSARTNEKRTRELCARTNRAPYVAQLLNAIDIKGLYIVGISSEVEV